MNGKSNGLLFPLKTGCHAGCWRKEGKSHPMYFKPVVGFVALYRCSKSVTICDYILRSVSLYSGATISREGIGW